MGPPSPRTEERSEQMPAKEETKLTWVGGCPATTRMQVCVTCVLGMEANAILHHILEYVVGLSESADESCHIPVDPPHPLDLNLRETSKDGVLSQVNPGLPAFLSCWESPRALCLALFSSSYILLTFPLSFQNIQLLVISLLTTFRHIFSRSSF